MEPFNHLKGGEGASYKKDGREMIVLDGWFYNHKEVKL
jgi:hypothetical protein